MNILNVTANDARGDNVLVGDVQRLETDAGYFIGRSIRCRVRSTTAPLAVYCGRSIDEAEHAILDWYARYGIDSPTGREYHP